MSILIYNSSGVKYSPLDKWLEGYEDEIILLTPTGHSQGYLDCNKKNFQVLSFDHWNSNWNIEKEAIKLHEQYNFTEIIALREHDIVRAGKLRDFLGLPGQTEYSAKCFKDKYLMKDLIRNNGLKTPNFQIIESYMDIHSFIKKNGFPVIIKPRDGAGSTNVYKIDTINQLRLLLDEHDFKNYIIENYIVGDVYHVDGIILSDSIKFIKSSRYINDCLEYQVGGSTASLFLSDDNELNIRLVSYAKSVFSALPCPKNFTFHLEVFLTPENEIIFCEVASRTGGGRISEAIKQVFGFHLNEELIKAQVGLTNANTIDYNESKWGKELRGWIMSSPRRGVLKYVPDEIPFDWITDYYKIGQVETVYTKARSSVHAVAGFVCKGESEEEVANRLLKIDEWFKSECIYEEDV